MVRKTNKIYPKKIEFLKMLGNRKHLSKPKRFSSTRLFCRKSVILSKQIILHITLQIITNHLIIFFLMDL